MEQFIHLPEFRFIVCSKCQYAVLPDEIDSHFKKTPVHGLNAASRRRIQERVARIDGLIRNKAELTRVGFTYPSSTSPPIRELGEAKVDGLRCTFDGQDGKQCIYVSRHEQSIREHCRDIHQWVNPDKKGRPRREKRGKDVPWQDQVHCQRFLVQGLHSGYFEVGRQDNRVPSTQTPEEKVQAMIQKRMDNIKEKERKTIEITDKAQQPNSWLRKVRWEHHLQGKDPDRLRTLIRPVDVEEEAVLAVIESSFFRIIDACHQHATPEVIGEPALCAVNSVEYEKKVEDPFYMIMKDDTDRRYRTVWMQILSFIVRSEKEWEQDDRPGYRLTMQQRKSFDRLMHRAEEFKETEVGDDMDEAARKQMRGLDNDCLEFCIRLLNHQLPGDAYENAIISGLSILGIKDGGGWLEATEYTTNYSAIVKLARALVIEHAYQTRCKQIESVQAMDYDEEQMNRAIECCTSHYELVRKMVNRFMGLEGARREPSPMDWIVSKRSYGMAIRFTTTADARVTWTGTRVIYRKIEFDMTQLQIMVHTAVANARMILMRDLMMIPLDKVGDIDEGQVPVVKWSALRDNMGETKVGWSFLDDSRNPFSVDGPWWLFKRVLDEPRLKRRFVQSVDPIQWRRGATEQFVEHLVKFQELLLFACHFSGGPPPRAPEILSIRHRNTFNGGLRNIGVDDGLLYYAPRTSKGFMKTGKEKIVHHYLPREVGELLMYYLWLVLPFWENVQVSIDEAVKPSPFLWGEPKMEADMGVEKEETVGEEEDGHDGPQDESQDDGVVEVIIPGPYTKTKTSPWYRDWKSERLRRIIQRQSKKSMDTKLNISAWRNIIEAISVQYLHHPFEFDQADEWIDEAFEWWAELGGHGRGMTEDMYGRLMTEAAGQRGSSRAKNRYASREWHEFLKFPSATASVAKPPKSIYDDTTRAMQIQRQRDMRNTEPQRALRAYMGDDGKFRGLQERAVQAVMNGCSPVLVVMGTGAGKSMVFMLPAFCGQGGTTIVVVPLTSLQDNLKDRCDKSGISCSIWRRGRAIEAAAVVLVTPESAMTKGFRDYVNLLRATHRLDRIVIDECHTVLASRPDFRPQLRHLGELARLQVQMVFMTATLRPTDEDEFCNSMSIVGKGVVKIRGCTSRPNIRYQIRRYESMSRRGSREQQDDTIVATMEVVEELRVKYPAPAKIIVYSRSKKRAGLLSEALGCMLYHADVADREGKSERLAEWMKGGEDSRVVVATSALGLGVDVGDTRAVVHMEKPVDLAEFVRESGRAGWDGEASESIIMMPAEVPEEGPARKKKGGINSRIAGQGRCPQPKERVTYRHKSDRPPTRKEEDIAAEVEEFVQARCRRVVLDRVMDSRFDRIECEEVDEECDRCSDRRRQERIRHGQDRFLSLLEDKAVEAVEAVEPVEPVLWSNMEQEADTWIAVTQQDIMDHEVQASQRSWVDFNARQSRQEEALEVEELERQYRRFKNRCPWCFINGRADNEDHQFADCRADGISAVKESMDEFVNIVHRDKTMERYSCCFGCFVPQDICNHWVPKTNTTDKGRWRWDMMGRCQFKGVVQPAFWGMVVFGQQKTLDWFREWGARDGYNLDEDTGCNAWLGKKIEWGGIEVNRFTQAFLGMARQVKDIEAE